MAKLAAVYCGDAVLPGGEPPRPAGAMFGAIEALDRADATEENATLVGAEVGAFSGYVVANQHLNKPLDADYLMARFVRQWLELPVERAAEPRVVDLAEAFADATGASLRDVLVVALALWVTVQHNGEPTMSPEFFDTLGWPADRLQAALQLFTADPATLRAGLRSEVEPGLAWAFSTLERYPVVRFDDGSLLVLDPHLLLWRVFGGLLLYDMVNPLRERGDRKRARAAEQCVQHLAEVYALEALYSVAGSGSASPRVFDDAALQAAFARPGRRIADAAVDYGDAWVVVEITTSKLKRQSVAASAESLGEDLDKLVGEAEQIDSTIAALRDEEAALTGVSSGLLRRFYPLLVVAEGFPVNPNTIEHLRQRVQARGLLAGPDVAPLEIVDTVELAMLEALAEQGGPGMRDVLAGKEKAAFFRMSVRDYLIHECRYRLRRSHRVDAQLQWALDLPLEALQAAGAT